MAGVEGQEEEIFGKAYDTRLARRLLAYLRPYRARVALAVLLLLAAAGLEVVGPLLVQAAIDRAIPAHDFQLLWRLVLLYVGALGLSFVFDYAQGLLTAWLGQRVMYDLRTHIFAHLQGLSLRFFDRNPVGRLMTRVTNDVEVLNELFSSGVVTVFGDIFTLLFILGAMLWMDPRLSLVTFSVLPFVFLAAFIFRGLIRQSYREIRVRLARINAFLQEHITGMRVVQLFGREAATAERFRAVTHDYLAAHLRSITYYALFFPVIEVFTALALALIIWYGGGEVVRGSLTVGVIAAFLQYARRFFRPIQDLSEKYNILQGAMASSERIFTLLDTQPEVRSPAAPRHLPTPGRGEIEFRDVWFSYSAPPPAATPGNGEQGTGDSRPGPKGEPAVPSNLSPVASDGGDEGRGGAEWVLRGVSFRAAPGQRVAIVGATGAGKSTIINLLMRFYDPQHGEILFDGVSIREIPLRELRDRIGLDAADSWGREVIPLEGEMLHGDPETLAAGVAAAQAKVKQMGLWARTIPRVRWPGIVDGRPWALRRGGRAEPTRHDRVRHPGARRGQRRDPPQVRHRRTEGTVAPATGRR